MKKITYIFCTALVLFVFSISARLSYSAENAHLYLTSTASEDDSISEPTRPTGDSSRTTTLYTTTVNSDDDSTSGPANVEVINPGTLTTPEERSKTKAVDTGNTSESTAGPAILEIDPVEGDPDHIEKDGVIQYNETDLDCVQNNETDLDCVQKNTVSIEAREIRGWDEKKKSDFLETVKEHAEVKSKQELENFAKGVLLEDENIKSVKADEESVRVEYEMPARFLGIFNTSLVARTEVANDGSGKVDYPWHSFLFKKLVSANDIKSEAEENVPEIDDEVLVLFQMQAKTIKMLSNIMKKINSTNRSSVNNIE